MRAISRFFRLLYLKLFRINDAPQKIAIGLGLGVFLGVFPGTGPIAALTLSLLLRVNRASALLGSVLTNTWLSIPVFFASMKLGSAVTGMGYAELRREWGLLAGNFRWGALLETSLYKIIVPVLAGYFIVALAIGAFAYLAALAAMKCRKKTR